MKATELKLIHFLGKQETQFVIPVYQRNYDWTKKECAKLLEDILTVDEDDTHFIGSIVFIQEDEYSTTGNYLTIIDGQQRLTTVMLLWLAIYHKALSVNEHRLAEKILETYLINKHIDDEEAKIKLKPAGQNAAALKTLLYGKPEEIAKIDDLANIYHNFKYFYQHIQPEQLTAIERGIGRLIFVEISLTKGKDDPQKIFESLNSTGLALNQADLIRNYILMDLSHQQQQTIYEQYWLPIEQLTTKQDKQENELSEFIRHFLSFKNREIPNKSKIYETFKASYPIKKIPNLESLLQEIKDYAGYYDCLINPDKEKNKTLSRHLHHLQQLEIGVSYPFLLEVYHDYATRAIDEQTFAAVLELTQTFVWRRFIVDLPTNALNKVFLRLYLGIRDKADYLNELQKSLLRLSGTSRLPNDAEIKNKLKEKDIYNSRPKNKLYFLSKLENHNNREWVEITENDHITIEHIFPQTPSADWKKQLSDTDYKTLESYRDTIANLTLSGNNGALSNKGFIQKRDLPDKGYADSRLFLNKFLREQDAWTPAVMEQRFELLLKRFYDIWTYPHHILVEKDGEQNIFEIEDPTGKNLVHYTFMGKRKNTSKFRDILRHVGHQLFELDASKFYQPKIKQKLKVVMDKSEHRSSLKMGEDCYIEGSLSAKDIFSRLKLLLEVYEMEDELFVKFSQTDTD